MSIWTMDIQYREYSMQNEYTFGCILFKNFIYLQSFNNKFKLHCRSMMNSMTINRIDLVRKESSSCQAYGSYVDRSYAVMPGEVRHIMIIP